MYIYNAFFLNATMSVFAAEAKRQWQEREEAVAAAGGGLRYLQALRLQKSFDAKRRQAESAREAEKARQAREEAQRVQRAQQALNERLARMGLTRVQVVGLEPKQPGKSAKQYKQSIKENLKKKRLENTPN